jgi:alcohol dehydrogenase class IV
LTGATRLRELGVEVAALDACVETAVARPQLDATPPRAGRDEVRALYSAAW